MNVSVAIGAKAKLPKAVEPRIGASDYPAKDAQTAAMFGVPPSDFGIDVSILQFLTMRIGVIGAVGVQLLRTLSRSADLAGNRRNLVNQRDHLCHVVDVGAGRLGGERNALSVREHVVFGSGLAAIRGIWAGIIASSQRTGLRAVDRRTLP